MDSTEKIEDNEKKKKKKKRPNYCKQIGYCFGLLLFSLLASLLCSFLFLFASDLPTWNPISVSSQCKILSSSVDIRSSKVCELGVFDYKAKLVFHPSERNNFRCHYDYYWASVFKVEYIDHSGQIRFAYTEAPNEALPNHCRPSFSIAWLTKDTFKVNETYNCWYTLGISKVDIYKDNFFKCKPNRPSITEYFLLCMRVLKSLYVNGSLSMVNWRWDALIGVITGFSTSLISFTVIGVLHRLKSRLDEICALRMVRLKRTCFFVAYFSFMSWLTIQYVKRIGLPEIM